MKFDCRARNSERPMNDAAEVDNFRAALTLGITDQTRPS